MIISPGQHCILYVMMDQFGGANLEWNGKKAPDIPQDEEKQEKQEKQECQHEKLDDPPFLDRDTISGDEMITLRRRCISCNANVAVSYVPQRPNEKKQGCKHEKLGEVLFRDGENLKRFCVICDEHIIVATGKNDEVD